MTTIAVDAPPHRSRGEYARRALRIAGRVAAGIVLLIFLLWAVLYITKGRFLKPYFERFASRSLGRQVSVGGDFQLYFAPLDIKFLAEDMAVANPAWASRPRLFEARLVESWIPTFPLVFGKRRADWFQLFGGKIDLEWARDGRNTWTFGQTSGKPLDLPTIRRAAIAGTSIRYIDPRMDLAADIAVDTVRATDNRLQDRISFKGDGRLRDRRFTMAGRLDSPNETLAGGQNRFMLDARSGGTVMMVAGTLPGATIIEDAKLRVAVRGPNMADLFAFMGVAVPDTRAWRMSSALTKHGNEWRFTGMKGLVGSSDVAGKMTITMPAPRLRIDADLASDALDIVDAGSWFGYDPKRLEAMGNKGAVRQVDGRPRLLPDAPLRVDAVKSFDARVNYSVRRIKAEDFPVSNLAMALTLDHGLLSLDPLTFDMARGHVTSQIAIDANAKPVRTSYDIRLSPTPMGLLLKGFGVAEAGTTGTIRARIQMVGLGDTVHDSLSTANGRIAVILPQGTMWTQNAQLAELDIGTFITKMFEDKLKKPVEINCGLIAFTVRDGVAAADPILIDTQKNVVVARGGFSFRTEALDMALRADGKKVSLFSGQSPVGLGGYFATPRINPISGQLIGRAGAAIGLGVVASPVAAVLAFVDIGDAKSASCGPVLAGATADQQRTTRGKPRDDVGHGTTAKSESGRSDKAERKDQRKKFLGIF